MHVNMLTYKFINGQVIQSTFSDSSYHQDLRVMQYGAVQRPNWSLAIDVFICSFLDVHQCHWDLRFGQLEVYHQP